MGHNGGKGVKQGCAGRCGGAPGSLLTRGGPAELVRRADDAF
jgi:hypothetical protein